MHREDIAQPFSRSLGFQDFVLEVGVENGPPRWEMVFLLWLIPIPYSHGTDDQPFYVKVHFQPQSQSVTFNPWQIYYLGFGTNTVRAAPAEVWLGNYWLGTNASTTFLATNDTEFTLKYSPWAQMYPSFSAYQLDLHPDRDASFQLSVEGVRIAGESFPLAPLEFMPTGHTRPGFQLPY